MLKRAACTAAATATPKPQFPSRTRLANREINLALAFRFRHWLRPTRHDLLFLPRSLQKLSAGDDNAPPLGFKACLIQSRAGYRLHHRLDHLA